MSHLVHNFEQDLPLRGARSIKWDKYAEDVLPMWVADSDFACPAPVVEAVSERALLGAYGYTHVGESFGKAVAHWQAARFGYTINPEHVLFLSAIVPALADAIKAFSHPGDKVVIQPPVYPPFHSVIKQCGRKRIVSPLRQTSEGWRMDFAELEECLADPSVKIFILCNPHNPVGRVFTVDELRRVGALCLHHGVIILADEIHCDLVYSGHRHVPFGSLGPDFANGSITFVSTSKTFNTPGVRAAAAIVPNNELRARLAEEMEVNKTAEPSLFGPIALETAYNHCAYYADQILDYLTGNVDVALAAVEQLPGITARRPEGTYLLWLDCRELCVSRGWSPEALERFMCDTAKVAMNNGADFGAEGEGFLRMNLACRRSTVEEAFLRISTALRGELGTTL